MAAGKPIVATNVGGNVDLIEHGVNGILVHPKDEEALANAVISILKDESLSHELSENALRIVKEKFSMPVMIENYEKIFRDIDTLKVLHVVSSGGLFGAEKVLLSIAGGMKEGNVENIVGAIENRHNPHLEVIEAAKSLGLKTVTFKSKSRFDTSAAAQIKRFAAQNRINVIHTHNYKADIFGFLASRNIDAKWIATNHVWHGTDAKLRIYEKIDAFLLRFADRVVAVSDEIRDDLVRKGVPLRKVGVIYNGIDGERAGNINVDHRLQSTDQSRIKPDHMPRTTKKTENLRKSLGIDENDIVITNVGRLSPEKGHEALLGAMEKIFSNGTSAKLVIVGDGKLRSSLQSTVRGRGLEDKIRFMGIRDDVNEILKNSDIYVNSSSIEGLPLTVLEAMSAGLPVVATRVGAIPHVIEHNVNGLLVDSGDKEGMTKAIDSLVNNKDLRRRLGDAARRIVKERFSVDRMAHEYREVYERLGGGKEA
jgi:glycosyltransferase involved in cell wall biosynthesis